jgi:hypothetical protein
MLDNIKVVDARYVNLEGNITTSGFLTSWSTMRSH